MRFKASNVGKNLCPQYPSMVRRKLYENNLSFKTKFVSSPQFISFRAAFGDRF